MERESRFSALVLIEAILQQRVPASAGGGIVERFAEIVAPQEPLVSSALRNDPTNGERRSNVCTVARNVPVPLPWTTRTS